MEITTYQICRIWSKFSKQITESGFLRDVSVLSIASLLTTVLNVINGILVARWLGPELYGLAVLVMRYPGLIFKFFDARSSQASVKYLSEFHVRQERERVLAMCKLGYGLDVAIATLAFVVVLCTASLVADRIVHRPETTHLIVLYAAAFIPKAMVGTSRAVLHTLGRFSLVGGIEIVTTIIRMGAVLGLILGGFDVAGVIWGNAVAFLVTGTLYGLIATHLIQTTWSGAWWRAQWNTLRDYKREIVHFLGFNELSALFAMIPKQLDVLVLGYFRGPAEVGYYNLASTIGGAAANVIGPLESVVYPRFSRLWGADKSQALKRAVKRYALKIGVPAGVLFMFMTVRVVPFVIDLLVGEDFLPASPAAQLLLVRSAVWLALFWLRPLLLTLGAVQFLAIRPLVMAVLTAVGLIVAVPRWGYIGAAWVKLITGVFGGYLSTLTYTLYYLRKRLQ